MPVIRSAWATVIQSVDGINMERIRWRVMVYFCEIFRSSETSRPSLGPTQPVEGVPRARSPWVKRLERGRELNKTAKIRRHNQRVICRLEVDVSVLHT